MRVRIIIPHRTIFDDEADKVTAPGKEGSFQILPKHVDAASSLTAGILTIFQGKEETYFAVNQGVLVKEGSTVSISCLQAMKGDSLETLNRTVSESFRKLDEEERRLRDILVKLEVDTLMRFMDID
jgi:F-type H+-transporting ATPase subunit epsilon